MDLFLHNTLTRQKELFEPIKSWEVKIYSCWPTVYSDPHIWNLRAFVWRGLLWDVFRYILNYKTTHVMNITDVWHLTDDADCGEDKMEKGSRSEWLSVWEVARKYENNFKNYMNQLNVHFDMNPRATDYIKEQIDIVKDLIKHGYTYEIPEDWIYMDTSKISDYGKLLWPNYKEALAWLDAGNRVAVENKRNITDFALWKFSPRGERRQMEWIFSWDRSWQLLNEDICDNLTEEENKTRWFPWWHIECSAMSRALLWKKLDIHTWGVDHISVHHTNEIAQSECSFCDHTPRVNYWLHNQFLNIDWSKISKSAGDDISIPWLIEKWYSPLDLRLYFFTGHYRSFLDFTWENLTAAKTTRENMIKKIFVYTNDRIVRFYDIKKEDINDILFMQFTKWLLDDLDTPAFLASIQKALWNLNDEVLKTILYIDKWILKIWLYDGVIELMEKWNTSIPKEVELLAQQRWDAKQEKEYQKADLIRNQLTEMWWEVVDTTEGWSLKKI